MNIRLFVLLLTIFLSIANDANVALAKDAPAATTPGGTKTAKQLAMDAYQQLDNHMLEADKIKDAQEKIGEAGKLDAMEPMVYVAMSNFVRVTSYRQNDTFELGSYVPGSIDEAMKYAEFAAKMPHPEPEADIMLGKLYIIRKEFAKARDHLEKAKLNGANMYRYNLYTGVIFEKSMIMNKAREYLDDALKYASLPEEKSWVYKRLLYVLYGLNDLNAAETLYKKIIEEDPTAQNNGNYGWFLISAKRCKDAAAQFKKTIAIASYPQAEQGLSEAQKCTPQK